MKSLHAGNVDLHPIDWKDVRRAVALRDSLRKYGFAAIANAPIDAYLIDRMYSDWRGWFTGSDPKKAYSREYRENPHEGWFALDKGETARERTRRDYKEYFHIFESTIRHGTVPLRCQSSTSFYFGVIRSWAEMVLEMLGPDLYRLVRGSENNLLRVLYYPMIEAGKELDREARAGSHTDINMLTFLPYSAQKGLQLRYLDKWIDVPNDRGLMIVNVGDALMEATLHEYPSVVHRVIRPDGIVPARMSLPFFLHARPDAELRPGLIASDHLAQRLEELGV